MTGFKKSPVRAGLFLGLAVLTASPAATDLRQATVKEAVNDVQIVPAGASSGKAAKVSDVLKTPDVMRTGSNSRAELLAADQTVARVGANTVFSFDPVGRKINLQQGTILFHAPTGRGGGVIQTAAATAAVTGTTIMVVSTRNGGFKVLVLEGKARVQLPNGKRLDLLAGQLSFILPGNQNFTNPITFRLGTLVTGSRMVNGFGRELASKGKIQTEINRQEKLLIADTGIEIGDFADDTGIAVIDNNTRQVNIDPPLTFELALQTDVTVRDNTLSDHRIFELTDEESFAARGLSTSFANSHADPYPHFVGRNIVFATGEFFNPTQATFLARENITTLGNLRSERLFFLPGGTVYLAPYSTLEATKSLLQIKPVESWQAEGITFKTAPDQYTGLYSLLGTVTINGGRIETGALVAGSPFGGFVSDLFQMNNTQLLLSGQSLIGANFGSQIAARTIILSNLNFPGGMQHNLNTTTGLWQAGGPSQANQTNLYNVKFNNTLITGSGGPGFIIGTSGNGINSGVLPP